MDFLYQTEKKKNDSCLKIINTRVEEDSTENKNLRLAINRA